MVEKFKVGSGLDLKKDIMDLIDWIEKRVDKRTKQPADMIFLSLVASEVCIKLVRQDWDYPESADEEIENIRLLAKRLSNHISLG